LRRERGPSGGLVMPARHLRAMRGTFAASVKTVEGRRSTEIAWDTDRWAPYVSVTPGKRPCRVWERSGPSGRKGGVG
jgi:hypothetical protein